MATLRIKYVYEDMDRHGNMRRYLQRNRGPKIRLRAVPGTDEFGMEYRAALNGKIEPRETERPQCTPAKNGSLRWLIEQYYASAEFKRLAAPSQPDVAFSIICVTNRSRTRIQI